MFPGVTGDHLDGSALRRRYRQAQTRAGLRPLRFHDLRHTFGRLAISRASVVQVQAWMGHADADTTHRYLHYKPRRDEARLLADAFAVEQPATPERPPLNLDSNDAGQDWIGRGGGMRTRSR